ncbi:MAG: alpha-L-rhamnosidase, partial [Kiritimatiellae bacterium]|nr:alpha-L-rhamnosidase [Kiritimatiellia bacterium]
LADHGHDGLIFDMTSVTNKPGYGYMIAKGNTSCHEAWDARTGSSHNHFMMADIVNWFYGSLAGIRRTSPGFKTFTVAPAFLEGLDWVKASHTAAGGEIRVAWHKEGRGVRLTVTVPPGTVATIRLPGKADVTQEPGERSYSVVLQTQ